MEKHMAVLMADLSGYTALTEVHGADSAADLIDKYVQIANSSLVGDAHLHERIGDEIMIVATSADDLLATALSIDRKTSKEENFLQLHGGLHYGKVLKRANSYFGPVINLTARITATAEPGTLRCSAEYVGALTNQAQYNITSRGYHHFKNIDDEKEIFQIKNIDQRAPYIDPVCRMLIRNFNNATQHPYEEGKYFCSGHCLNIYMARQRRQNLERVQLA